MTTVQYTRSEWRACFSGGSAPDFEFKTTTVPALDVEDIYIPLVSFITKWRDANIERTKHLEQLLRLTPRKTVPFIIGVAGSVAAGKSTTSRLIVELLTTLFPDLKVEMLSTDHFLYPNAELQTRGIMDRKGFPESYDWDKLHLVLSDIKNGNEDVFTPIYSHAVYDITGELNVLKQPDILVLEGINVLQAGYGSRPISDWLDFKLYVDADEEFVFNWYWKRVQSLVLTADQDPSSYFHQFKSMDESALFAFAKRIWRDINAVNLHDYILPSRERADLILKKGADHAIQTIELQASWIGN
jgi:type I pantothenate kinase